ncbi:MAG TPA: VWA domain-containing protein [Thermoanaerobaculia bacterium]|jgi:Ca-activated chloride channel family protein|nr:VWA domain-containing protein [Thermoanaerobaculia bacterium]
MKRILLLLILLPFPAVAAEVRLVSPAPNQPLFGEVEIRAEVQGAPVSKVEFYVDSLRVGVAEAPPWRIVVDVGQNNQEHSIEVLAYGPNGPIGSAALRSLLLQVDDEIEVGLQQLYVVVERGNRRITDLSREDFTVLDDGVPQQLITFERGEIPFTAVLLVDASTSMAGDRLRTATDGAKGFVAGMKRLDEAKLLLFSDRILLETPFTSVPSIVSLGLSGVQAQGGTALNDALYLALKRLEGSQGRRVVVLLSDGIDIESVLSMEQVQEIARRTHAVLYWLRLRRYAEQELPFVEIFSAWRDGEGHRRQIDLLQSTVLESGGRIETLDTLDQVKPALETLLRELRDQYVLGYYPSTSKGRGTWHDLELRVKGEGLTVRTQEGYLER